MPMCTSAMTVLLYHLIIYTPTLAAIYGLPLCDTMCPLKDPFSARYHQKVPHLFMFHIVACIYLPYSVGGIITLNGCMGYMFCMGSAILILCKHAHIPSHSPIGVAILIFACLRRFLYYTIHTVREASSLIML